MSRSVTLVCGPPCAGKSTYVSDRAQPGDLVLDQDVIGAKAMRAGLAHIAVMTDGTAWIIRCSPGRQQRAALAQQIRADHVVLLLPPEAELTYRAARRPNARRQIQAVRDWIKREAEDAPPIKKGGGRPEATTTQRGYGWEHQQARSKALRQLREGDPCPYCEQPMARAMKLDYDHYPAMAQGGSPTGPRRLTHASCNRRAGQAIAVARRSPNRVVNSRAW